MVQDWPEHAHWSDEPLAADAPDEFGRDSFVTTIVQRLQRATADDPSTVFGLVGPWGSGKTSVLERVRRALAGDWLIADFTPWSSGDAASMSLEFVNTLAEVLGEKTSGDLRSRLAGYAGFAAPLLGTIPFVGAGVKGTVEQTLEALAQRPPWHRQFAELSDAVAALGKRVLIVVDDVDRLGGNELLALLRVIRLLGRFRGVHYLVAYDQDTVEDLLRTAGSVGRSAAFMEKIVQYPFETPPVPGVAVVRLLNSVLQDLQEATSTQFDALGLQRASALVEVLAPQIHTPRTLGRFREHLVAFASHVQSAELDLLDYVAVTWLRLAAHGVWSSLPNWHRELRSGQQRTGLLESRNITAEEWEERVSAAGGAIDVHGTIGALSFLFEGVSVRGMNAFIPHPHAMSDSTYFGRYLLLAIPEDDVSDALVDDLLQNSGTDDSLVREVELAQIIDSRDDALASLAIARISAKRERASAPNMRLLDFLAERYCVRSGEDGHLGAPQNGLRRLLAREMALAITSGATDAVTMIAKVGEKNALSLVWAAPKVPDFRARGEDIARGFADYWFERLPTNLRELRSRRMLGAVAEIITFCLPPQQTLGVLDHAVTDYSSYIELATDFVDFAEWVGRSVSYELKFRGTQFAQLVSPQMHERYREAVAAEAGTLQYDTDDHVSREVPSEIIRAFVVDSILAQEG